VYLRVSLLHVNKDRYTNSAVFCPALHYWTGERNADMTDEDRLLLARSRIGLDSLLFYGETANVLVEHVCADRSNRRRIVSPVKKTFNYLSIRLYDDI